MKMNKNEMNKHKFFRMNFAYSLYLHTFVLILMIILSFSDSRENQNLSFHEFQLTNSIQIRNNSIEQNQKANFNNLKDNITIGRKQNSPKIPLKVDTLEKHNKRKIEPKKIVVSKKEIQRNPVPKTLKTNNKISPNNLINNKKQPPERLIKKKSTKKDEMEKIYQVKKTKVLNKNQKIDNSKKHIEIERHQKYDRFLNKNLENKSLKNVNNDVKNYGNLSLSQEKSSIQSYLIQIKNLIEEKWKKPELKIRKELFAIVEFEINSSGECYNVNILNSSGNNLFDESILFAFKSLKNLPRLESHENSIFRLAFEQTI